MERFVRLLNSGYACPPRGRPSGSGARGAIRSIFSFVGNLNPGVDNARLPDLPIPWVAGSHLQQEPGAVLCVVNTEIRVVNNAEDAS